jgi:DNA processing protein
MMMAPCWQAVGRGRISNGPPGRSSASVPPRSSQESAAGYRTSSRPPIGRERGGKGVGVLTEEERLLLCLAHVPGIGERGLDVLLRSGIPLAHLFTLSAEELRGRFGLTSRAAATIAGGPEAVWARGVPLARTVMQQGIRLLRRRHPGYPTALAESEGAPPLLFAHGNIDLLMHPSMALLSSSKESRAGLERTGDLALACAKAGIAIVAGHNRPCYRAAVSSAKAHGGGRIIVLDRGLLDAFQGDFSRDLFPTARLWGYGFDRERSVALSPFPLDAHFAGLRNRQRDRVVALLASVVVAVEIRSGGVMEGECRKARQRGTPVFVCAGPDIPEGNRALLADGFPPLPEVDPVARVLSHHAP